MTTETTIDGPGDLIREIVRAYYGGKDAALAKDAGVNRATVGRWISEERAISAIEMFRVIAVVTSGHPERDVQVAGWLVRATVGDSVRVRAAPEIGVVGDALDEIADLPGAIGGLTDSHRRDAPAEQRRAAFEHLVQQVEEAGAAVLRAAPGALPFPSRVAR